LFVESSGETTTQGVEVRNNTESVLFGKGPQREAHHFRGTKLSRVKGKVLGLLSLRGVKEKSTFLLLRGGRGVTSKYISPSGGERIRKTGGLFRSFFLHDERERGIYI